MCLQNQEAFPTGEANCPNEARMRANRDVSYEETI